jgi:hypothetical protein
MYAQLDPSKIIETIARLKARIHDRFPDADLGHVCADLLRIGETNAARIARIHRPNLLLRTGVIFLILAAVGLLVRFVIAAFNLKLGDDLSSVVQTIDAAIETLVFLSAGILFLVTLEARLKRQRAINAIHELRALAHIVDMHQLTKDPDTTAESYAASSASPERTLTRAQLSRYLDYCSEMLSLVSKVAALYAQNIIDPVVLSAVDQIEDLTTRLSGKIWQKIMILEQMMGRERA